MTKLQALQDTLAKLNILREVNTDINKLKGLSIRLVFKADIKADYCTINIKDKTPIIYMNKDTFTSKDISELVGILCHEYGHILDKGNIARPVKGNIENVIAYEKAANDIGIELYSTYFDSDTYINNHDSMSSMEKTLELYTNN